MYYCTQPTYCKAYCNVCAMHRYSGVRIRSPLLCILRHWQCQWHRCGPRVDPVCAFPAQTLNHTAFDADNPFGRPVGQNWPVHDAHTALLAEVALHSVARVARPGPFVKLGIQLRCERKYAICRVDSRRPECGRGLLPALYAMADEDIERLCQRCMEADRATLTSNARVHSARSRPHVGSCEVKRRREDRQARSENVGTGDPA